MMVDTHLHPLTDDLQRYPMVPIGTQSAWSKGGFHLTGDEILKHMASAGVDQATLVQASTAHGYDNSFCADTCARYPAKFVGVCCIDPLAPDAADTLSTWVEGRGMRGVRLFCISGVGIGEPAGPEPRWLDDPRTYPTWERAEQLGIPVDVQVAASGLDMVRNMLDRYPRIKVILGHLAGPSLRRRPALRGGPRPASDGAVPEPLPEVHDQQHSGGQQGQVVSPDVLRDGDRRVWREPPLLGLELPGHPGKRPGPLPRDRG